MNLVAGALKRPITIIVLVFSFLLFSIIAIRTIPIDIFPKLNLPTIYVIESYGGMSPKQMEGFFATRMQDQFLYVNGIQTMSSKNIQGLTLLKLTFYENTNMAEASAQIALQVNRAMKFFPPGALPPQVIRFDASSLPVGELVFSSNTKSLKEIYDLATTRIRPMFASVPGLSAPPPFGANSRSVVVSVDPDKLRSYALSPDEVVEDIAKSNVMSPSGNLRSGNLMYVTTINTLEKTVDEFSNIPLKTKNGGTVFLNDVAKVADAADVTVDYALINGKRSVYIPVVKTADASTWEVVQKLKATLPEMQNLLPDDVKLDYAFDQSVFVINAVKSLMTEGILGALLTGLMVLLFLRDWRSSVIVIITIPVSILITLLLLKMAGQTINLMTLSGLALAIGILVDQATVTIENIHQHLETGQNLRSAIFEATSEISFPLLLILLCILAVFAPSFIMQGVPKAMFLPLSLSIGFAMIISYLLAQTLVPILSNWLLKAEKFRHNGTHHNYGEEALTRNEIHQIEEHLSEERNHPENNNFFEKIKGRFMLSIESMMGRKKLIVGIYGIVTIVLISILMAYTGRDMMPHSNSGQFQIRFKEPEGTRLEQTEAALKQVIAIIDSTVKGHVSVTSAYVGLVPSSYGTSNLYVFNSGTHEAVLQVNLEENYKVDMDELKDVIRKNVHYKLPDSKLVFEPIELTDKIMSQGASTPIEVRVAGKDFDQIHHYADTLVAKMKMISYLRDVQIAQPVSFPNIAINIDRFKAAQFGLNVEQIARSVTASTSSSRFTEKNQWLDEKAAYTYQVQVQIPEYVMSSLDELKEIPLIKGQTRPILSDVATLELVKAPGEYDRSGPRRFLTVNANLYKKDLGTATNDVNAIINKMGTLPKGLNISIRGMSSLLTETLNSLQTGLLFAVIIIFLLLSANYESFKLGGIVLITVPAVVLGSLIFLAITGGTLNLQSYMGIIMSIGVSVANAILIVTNAEKLRLEYANSRKAAVTAAAIRLRPILMTTLAMIAGMIPMASGMGEAGDQTAPLGRAVIGGLIASTFSALFILPLAFAWFQNKSSLESRSLLPKLKSMKLKAPVSSLSILIVIATSILCFSCGSKEKPVDLTVKAMNKQEKIAWIPVNKSSFTSVVKLPGDISAFESVDIYPKVNGFIQEVYVDRGSIVKKGQLLMRLEAPEIKQQVQTAKANLAKAKEVYQLSKERYDRLLETSKTPGTVSPFDLSSAQSKMQSEEASLRAEESSLQGLVEVQNYLNVRAPFDGIITDRNIHPGALVGPNTKTDKAMLVLQKLNPLRLTVQVPEEVAARINTKEKIDFTLSDYPEKVFTGQISRASGVISSNVRSEAIEIDIPSENGLIKPGMYAEVHFPVNSSVSGFVIPSSAIVHSTKGIYVIGKDAEGNSEFISIKEGMNSKDTTEVFGNLKEGQMIMAHPSSEIENGVKLE